ncbi:dUTP diphosphatase [Bacillus badius]|uniref:dUTP diphosphatase n=1 Tax=Bacillus badius TaxID=1455 RepID=UPI002E1B4F86|nr:dUTP diphosphatase [Bacillus badius]
MNLTKLFDMQRVLNERIMDKHPELKGQNNLDWKILALQVELGELANNWRGFKKWSNDQEPRTAVICESCRGSGGYYNTFKSMKEKKNKVVCKHCNGWGIVKGANPLLEEYVDCLHFILSIGLELKAEKLVVWSVQESESIIDMFNRVFMQISVIQSCMESRATIIQTHYSILVDLFVELGQMLGFTWEQIEAAYMSKNAVNHQRQESGY